MMTRKGGDLIVMTVQKVQTGEFSILIQLNIQLSNLRYLTDDSSYVFKAASIMSQPDVQFIKNISTI